MTKNYCRNLVDVRLRRKRILAKRIELRKQLNNTSKLFEKKAILKRIEKITLDLDNIEKEFAKTNKTIENINLYLKYNSVKI